MFTQREKEPRGPTATEECQSGVCSSLSRLWVGEKSVLPPFLIIARERRGCQTDDSAE